MYNFLIPTTFIQTHRNISIVDRGQTLYATEFTGKNLCINDIVCVINKNYHKIKKENGLIIIQAIKRFPDSSTKTKEIHTNILMAKANIFNAIIEENYTTININCNGRIKL